MNFTEFYFEIQFFLFCVKNYNHTSSESQKHSAVKSRTQISVILGQNQQQPVVVIQ